MQAEPDARRFPDFKFTRAALLLLLLALSYLLVIRGVLPGFAPPLGDFANYYTAARVAVEGGPISEAYLDPLWFQKQIDRQGIEGQLGGFIPHPPPAALVMLPLTPFSPLRAKQVWTLVNLILLGCTIWMLQRLSGLASVTCAAVVLLSGAAMWHNFAFGQLYLLLLASLLASLFFHARGQPVLAGISLGFLIPVKYFGAPWLLYWAWRRQWRLVLAGALTAGAVALLTLFLVGPEPFVWFWRQVLPRHLAGEIQNPYAQGFQSWTSLYRRLFLHDELLNPNPALQFHGAFLVARNLTFWVLLAWGLSLVSARRPEPPGNGLRDSAWIATFVLLLSPAAASYHFVLLILPAAFFAAQAWNSGRHWRAFLTASIFGAVNLPHFLYLEPLAEGWWNLAAYSRLWLLLLFAAAGAWSCQAVGDRFRRWWLLVPLAGFPLSIALDAFNPPVAPEDGAQLLKVEGPQMDSRLGLVLTEPHPVANQLVFTYIEGLAGRYAPFDGQGRRRIPAVAASYFNPQLQADGERLLVETWSPSGPSIELSLRRALPGPLTDGEEAIWLGNSSRIAFLRRGIIQILDTETGEVEILEEPSAAAETKSNASTTAQDRPAGRIVSLSSSADGRWLAFSRQSGHRHFLYRLDLEGGIERTVAATEAPIRDPQLSPDGERMVMSLYREGNWDIWMLSLADGSWRRVTRHPAADGHPSWTSDQGLIFTSDRGRGLGFTVLYEIAPP